MNKLFLLLIIMLLNFSCNTIRRSAIGETFNIDSIIYYSDPSIKKGIECSSVDDINNIISIINSSRGKIIKFIPKETFEIVSTDNDTLIVLKFKKYLNINGRTYVLSPLKCRELDRVLVKLTDSK